MNNITLPNWATQQFDRYRATGRLEGERVRHEPVDLRDVPDMEDFIASHLEFLEHWDNGNADRDPAPGRVENSGFVGVYQGDRAIGSTQLFDHRAYVEESRFTEESVDLVAFNSDGRGWLFHVDRANPENSFTEYRPG